jgi:hypothetical protein
MVWWWGWHPVGPRGGCDEACRPVLCGRLFPPAGSTAVRALQHQPITRGWRVQGEMCCTSACVHMTLTPQHTAAVCEFVSSLMLLQDARQRESAAAVDQPGLRFWG